MTKTISINLGGELFHISQTAFDTLRLYLTSVEKQFQNEKEAHEVLYDVEDRIAELLSERMNKDENAITQTLIEEIIKTIGEAHNFTDEIEQEQADIQRKTHYSTIPRRMYRDSEAGFLGGVCSGLSVYFRLEAWLFRVIFIIFSFFFFGGLVIYLILWIAIPKAKTTAQKLEMRGEPVTLENIKNMVTDEFNEVKRQFRF